MCTPPPPPLDANRCNVVIIFLLKCLLFRQHYSPECSKLLSCLFKSRLTHPCGDPLTFAMHIRLIAVQLTCRAVSTLHIGLGIDPLTFYCLSEEALSSVNRTIRLVPFSFAFPGWHSFPNTTAHDRLSTGSLALHDSIMQNAVLTKYATQVSSESRTIAEKSERCIMSQAGVSCTNVSALVPLFTILSGTSFNVHPKVGTYIRLASKFLQ